MAGHVDGDAFSFTWQEYGGPAVAPPTRQGFGNIVLQGVAGQFADKVEMTFPPAGLEYRLRILLGRLEVCAHAAGRTFGHQVILHEKC